MEYTHSTSWLGKQGRQRHFYKPASETSLRGLLEASDRSVSLNLKAVVSYSGFVSISFTDVLLPNV